MTKCKNCGAKMKNYEPFCSECGADPIELRERMNFFQKFAIIIYVLSLIGVISFMAIGNGFTIFLGIAYFFGATFLFFLMYALACIVHELRVIKRYVRNIKD